MEIKSSLCTLLSVRRSQFRKGLSLILISLFLACCQTTKVNRLSDLAQPSAASQAPPLAATTETPEKKEPKRVAVILGPGGAKTFAHVGVLKSFQRQRIPIQKVVGLEWGALIGALYVNKGQVHDLEWKLYKMGQHNLPHPKGGFFSRRNDETVHVMDNYFAEVFGNSDVARARLGFSCASQSVSGAITWEDHGQFKDVVERCLPFPPVFRSQGDFIAGASLAKQAVEQLVKENFNLIILIDVLGSASSIGQDGLPENANHVILWQEVKRSLTEAAKMGVESVEIDTSAYSITKFEAKKELLLLGEMAGQKAATALVSKYGF